MSRLVVVVVALAALVTAPTAPSRPQALAHKCPKGKQHRIVKGKHLCVRTKRPAPKPKPKPDTTPPALQSASVEGTALTVTFSEDVVADARVAAAFTANVSGRAETPIAASASGRSVVLTLARAVGGDEDVTLDFRGGVNDRAGNAAAPATGVVVANAGPVPCSFMVDNRGLGALNEGLTDHAVHPSSLGELRAVVIWVDFPDAPASESINTLTNQIFSPAAAAYTGMSYGKFSLRITPTSRWYRLPETSRYYGLNSSDGPGRKDEYIAAAVRAADADVDFRQYDLVYLVPAAGASADQPTNTVRPAGAGIASVDGTEVRRAVLLGSDRLTRPTHGYDQVIHETGHILGLPDLYADLTAVGGWDPMSLAAQPGAEFIAWHRWKFGWIEPAQMRCVQPGKTVEATLTPLEVPGGVKAMLAPIDAARVLVIENRQPLGLDSLLCDKGVLIYTVNGAVDWNGVPVRAMPAHPGTDSDPAKLQSCAPIYDAPFDLGPGEVSTYTDPASGARIQLVSASGSSYVVRVSR